MSDLIERQAAIDVAKGPVFMQGIRSGKSATADAVNAVKCMIVDGLRDLPSAQPEPCEDAVSRKAVKDGFVEMCNLICPYTEKQRHAMCGSCLLGTAFDVLEATRSVTPKQRTGKWIDGIIPNDSGGLPVIVCDQCNTFFPLQFGDGHNFCPNCGAKMEGGAE